MSRSTGPRKFRRWHENAATAIRAADSTAILFVSPEVLTSAGRQTELTMPTFDNLAYLRRITTIRLGVVPRLERDEPDEPFMFMSGIAQSWDAPLFLGEFGAPPTTDDLLPYMDTMYHHLDAVLGSGTQWVYTPGWTPTNKDGWNTEDYSIVDDTGALRDNFQVRPYAGESPARPRA